MSDDELEKLAAEMQNIKPTDAARERGMAAAMAAFDSEFESASAAVEAGAKEKNLSPDQGLATAPRPTGQSTGIGSVWTFGGETMRKITDLFSFNGKAAMMVGTCAAALFATSLYIPNTRFEEMPSKPAPQAVTAEVGASDTMSDEKFAEADETVVNDGEMIDNETIVVTGSRMEKTDQTNPIPIEVLSAEEVSPDGTSSVNDTLLELPSAPAADNAAPATQSEPEAQGGINSISGLLNQVRNESRSHRSRE